MNELEFEQQLYDILDIYTENGEYDLDGDEVDKLVEHLRNELNLICGNITNAEYNKLETLKETMDKIKNYICSDYHRLEDFTDLEICCEKDLDETERLTDLYIYSYLTSDDIIDMYSEIQKRNIDLAKWGMIALDRGGVE